MVIYRQFKFKRPQGREKMGEYVYILQTKGTSTLHNLRIYITNKNNHNAQTRHERAKKGFYLL